MGGSRRFLVDLLSVNPQHSSVGITWPVMSGSGQSAAQMTARHAASGRRAHQMCSVEICPCRILFSRRACAEIRLIGRSTSISHFGYCGISDGSDDPLAISTTL